MVLHIYTVIYCYTLSLNIRYCGACCYTVLYTVTHCYTLSLDIREHDTCCFIVWHTVTKCYTLSMNIRDCIHAFTQCYKLSPICNTLLLDIRDCDIMLCCYSVIAVTFCTSCQLLTHIFWISPHTANFWHSQGQNIRVFDYWGFYSGLVICHASFHPIFALKIIRVTLVILLQARICFICS